MKKEELHNFVFALLHCLSLMANKNTITNKNTNTNTKFRQSKKSTGYAVQVSTL
jgi:hypothetical protein